MPKLPVTIGLAAFWFLFLAGFGAFFPFYAVWLKRSAGLDPTEVGTVFAVMPLASLVAQPFWGAISDRSGRRRRVLVILSLGAASGLILISRAEGFAELALATFLMALFSSSVIPMLLAVGFAMLGEGHRRSFGPIRLFGTLGYLAGMEIVAHAPWLGVDGRSAGDGPARVFLLAAAFVLLGAVSAWLLPDAGESRLRSRKGDFRRLFRIRAFVALLVFTVLVHLSIQGPQHQLSLVLEMRGADIGTIGVTWRLMLLLELPCVWMLGWARHRLGSGRLVALGLVSEAIRWTAGAHADSLFWLCLVQGLHGIGVACLLIGLPLHLESIVPKELRSTAQSLLATAGIACGTMISNRGFGALLDRFGPERPLAFAGAGCLVLAVLSLAFIRPPDSKTEPAATGSGGA